MKVKQKKSVDEPTEIIKISCLKCLKCFGVERRYMGIITCPYCGEYVEG